MIVTADGELDKQQWAETVKGLTSRGAIASEYEVAGKEDDTFLYKVTIAVGDHEPLHLTSKATVKDGQIIRVEPSDPAEFTTLAGRSRSIRRIE